MNGSTLAHAVALAFAAIAGCSPAPSPQRAAPPVNASKADDAPRRAAFDEADKVFRRGYVDAAIKRWRAMADYPPAVARLALLENRPEAVLAIPITDDPRLLNAHMRAAVLLGDVKTAERVVPLLAAVPGAERSATGLR